MQSTIGIHIQPYCIHTAFVQNAKPPVVTESHAYPLSLDDNEEQRKIKIDNYLKEILQKYPHHHFSFIIPHQQISVHDIQFPFKERFKIQKALPFKIEDLIPFSIEQMVYTYKISGYCDQQSHILSFMAPQTEIFEFIDWIQSIGFQSYSLTPEVASLSNLFENWREPPPEIQGLSGARQIKVYLSYHQSIALVFCQNRVISIYNLNWGFYSCVQDIAHKYRRDMDQALDYFFENAILTHENMSDTVKISQIVRTSFKSLAQQLHLLLIYLKGQNSKDIEEITLLGPGGSIQNLSYHLYEYLKVPVHKMEKYEDIVTPAYLPAFAVALESFKKSSNPAVNFSQSVLSTQKASQLKQKKIQIFKTVSFALLCFFSYIGARNWQISKINDKMNSIFSHYSRSIAGLKTRNISTENVEKYLNQKKDAQTQSNLFQSLTHLPSAIDQLKKLSFSFDQLDLWQITISQMDIEGNRIHMQGAVLKLYISQLKSHLKSQAKDKTFQLKKADLKIIDQLKSAQVFLDEEKDKEKLMEKNESFTTQEESNNTNGVFQDELHSENKNLISTQKTLAQEWEPFNFIFTIK